MLEHLGGKRYSNFKAGLAQMLTMGDTWTRDPITRGGHARPHRVRDVVPALVHAQLSAVRAYDEWVASGKAPHERFHRLRIQVKLLRYTLEFFKDALGPEAKPAIERLKSLQDHLGGMHDTVVAIAWLEAHASSWTQAEAYLDNRRGALERSLAEFPAAWSKVMAPDFRMLVDKVLFALSHGKG
jgi:CHAD domain-containing protein